MRVLIVDDEPPARERLRRMLAELEGVEVVGEAADGVEAIHRAAQLAPDVLLLDIRMPGVDGLEAARHLVALPTPPALVFTTAFGEHALEAFESQAVDYLLKPIRAERLARALERARRLTATETAALSGRRARSHFTAHLAGRLEVVPVSDVIYLLADQKYIAVRHLGGEVLIEESLKGLEEEFGERFIRIHRNALVAAWALAGVEREGEGRLVAILRGTSDRPEISRRHAPEVRARIRNGVS